MRQPLFYTVGVATWAIRWNLDDSPGKLTGKAHSFQGGLATREPLQRTAGRRLWRPLRGFGKRTTKRAAA